MTYCNKCKLPIGDFGSPMFEAHYCTDSNTRTLESIEKVIKVMKENLACRECGRTSPHMFTSINWKKVLESL